MSDNVHTFTDANFQAEVIDSDQPVLVDFWAPWCGPCRMVAPTVEALADDYQGKLKVGKVNIDDNPSVARQFGIRSIPSLLVFKGGEVAEQVVGALPRPRLEERVKPHV